MNAPSENVKDLLVTANVGVFGRDLFIGREPKNKKNCVTIYDTGGAEQNAKWATDESTVQVRIKNSSYKDGYAQAERVKLALEGIDSVVVDIDPTTSKGTLIVGIWCNSNIAFMKHAEDLEALFSVNFRIVRDAEIEADAGYRELF